MAHPVVHAEIRSTDPDATRAFFTGLFGWSYSDGAYPGYTFVDTGVEGALPTAISPLQGDDDAVIWFVGVQDVRAALGEGRGARRHDRPARAGSARSHFRRPRRPAGTQDRRRVEPVATQDPSRPSSGPGPAPGPLEAIGSYRF